jgi:tRNA A-37 threonylcarbamoyl transferase component Bud32
MQCYCVKGQSHNVNPYHDTFREQVIQVVTDVASNLNKMHQEGYLHNEIKSSNVILVPDGNNFTVSCKATTCTASTFR